MVRHWKVSRQRFSLDSLIDLESNIEEVLNLPDLSRVPKAFLTEIQQDQAYSTIYSELQKKLPHQAPSTPSPPPPVPQQTEEPTTKLASPRVFAPEDDDEQDEDELSLIDDKSSTISSSVNPQQAMMVMIQISN